MAAPSAIPIDRVVVPDPASGFDLYIFSMYEKPGWQTRVPGDQTHAPHPGTAVSYQDEVYEVREVGPGTGTPYTYRYGLRKWEDRFVVRRIFPYTLEAERRVARELMERRRQHRQNTWLLYLFPITGALPSPLLQKWQREWGLPMRVASFLSAAVIGVSCLVGFSYLFSDNKQSHPVAIYVLGFIGIEQVVRFVWLACTSEAQGSTLVTLVWALLGGAGARPQPRRKRALEGIAEEVRYLKEQPWDVEIHTLFRDPVLLGDAAVQVEDKVYQPLGFIVQGEGLSRRYVFRLKLIKGETRASRQFTRERTPAQLAWLLDYEKARDRVHAWSLLFGLLPARRQLELETKYDLLSAQATTQSALLMLVACGLKFLTLLIGPADIGHFGAAYFALESFYRLAMASSRGEPAGSLIGWLLTPFVPG